MRIWMWLGGFLIATLLAGAIGYQIAASDYARKNQEREAQLQKEISLILSVIADIADHRSRDETEIADWKFSQIHGSLESYVRAGGGPPSQFAYDIVEATEVSDEDDEEDEDDEGDEGDEEEDP